jgi:menaquinone-dependent protoporphyrinogen oxidase
MRVLVGYASKHGGTREIAERIAGRLRLPEVDVEVGPLREIGEVAGFDAFVLGSSIHMGHWSKEAVVFVHRHKAALGGRPVWLFSSGPVGNQARVDPIELPDLEATVPIREHRLFGGAVKLDKMSFAERLMAKAIKVSGDYPRVARDRSVGRRDRGSVAERAGHLASVGGAEPGWSARRPPTVARASGWSPGWLASWGSGASPCATGSSKRRSTAASGPA